MNLSLMPFFAMPNEYGVETWHREANRVKAAVLKLANGNLDALRRHVDVAKRDYRDALLAAEYPEYWQRSSSPARKLESIEAVQVIDRDREQYRSWIERP